MYVRGFLRMLGTIENLNEICDESFTEIVALRLEDVGLITDEEDSHIPINDNINDGDLKDTVGHVEIFTASNNINKITENVLWRKFGTNKVF